MNHATILRTSAVPPPWYRQPWPWLLIAGPALVVVAAFFTPWLACPPTTASSPTTITGAACSSTSSSRDGRARAMAARRVVRVAPAARSASTSRAAPPTGAGAVTLQLAHATRAGKDRQAMLTQGSDSA